MVIGSHAHLPLHSPPRLLNDAQWGTQLLLFLSPRSLDCCLIPSLFHYPQGRDQDTLTPLLFPSPLHLSQCLPIASVLFIFFELGRDLFRCLLALCKVESCRLTTIDCWPPRGLQIDNACHIFRVLRPCTAMHTTAHTSIVFVQLLPFHLDA